MSSPHSPQPADGLAALGAAAVQVAEDSLFAYAEACALSRAAGLVQRRVRLPSRGWRRRSRSPARSTAVVRLALPQALAADLAGAFCGVRPQSLDAGPDRGLRRRAGQHGVRAVADADAPQRAVRAGRAGRRRGRRRRRHGARCDRCRCARHRAQQHAPAARPRRAAAQWPSPDMSSQPRTRVLLVDDSAVVRKLLGDALRKHADIEVIGGAADPYIARDMILQLQARRHHARHRDAAHGRPELPAQADGAPPDPGDRGELADPAGLGGERRGAAHRRHRRHRQAGRPARRRRSRRSRRRAHPGAARRLADPARPGRRRRRPRRRPRRSARGRAACAGSSPSARPPAAPRRSKRC